ncbi:MAG TPA: hypothetical protein VHC69_08720 [Polyangiaceae bacterium]|nr:hypothetical protein [Polyangiaceae bacterium]
MADDHRRRGPGQRGAEAANPGNEETVALPEHASAYFSPRSPPIASAHPTLETEAIRLDPAIDPDNAVTRPLKVDGLSPPPWLGQPLRSDAPTVLVPVVRARRRRKRAMVGIAAAAVGILAGIVYGVTRPISPRQPADFAPQPVHASAPETPRPTTDLVAPPAAAPEPSPAEEPSSAPAPSSATPDEKSTQLAPRSSPNWRAQAAPRRARPASSAPSAWLKSEPPKPWFK